jgi:hypothetical protein
MEWYSDAESIRSYARTRYRDTSIALSIGGQVAEEITAGTFDSLSLGRG